MAFSKAGIRAVVISPKSTIDTTPASAKQYFLGLRNKGKLIITGDEEIKDYRDRPLRNMINFKAEFDTYQSTIAMLADLVQTYAIDGYCDALIASERNAANTHDGIFKFTTDGGYPIGLDFEFVRSNKENFCKMILEGSYEYEIGQTILLAALSLGANTNVPIMQVTNPGRIDHTKFYSPVHVGFTDNGSTYMTKYEIVERKISFKNKGAKNGYKMTNSSYITVQIDFTGNSATMANINTLMSAGAANQVIIQDKAGSGATEVFTFNANLFSRKDTAEIGDEDRIIKMSYTADVPVYDFSFGTNTVTVSC